ncbi:unnamed protein product, partial [Strongylus vulgaris]
MRANFSAYFVGDISLEDELRDRFRDHVVAGPELASLSGLDGEQCKDACFSIPEAAIYTWSPDDLDDDDATI